MQVLNSFHPLAVSAAPEQQLFEAKTQPEVMVSASPASSRTLEAAFAAPEADKASVSANATALKYQHSERTSLYIKTQEGDVVRLKFRTNDTVSFRSSHAENENGEVSELTLKTSSATKLSVRVKGDLNAEELAAIQDTIEQASALAENFFAGDVAAAFEGAAALDIDGGQLARVKLKLKTMEQMTYSSRSVGSRASMAKRTPEVSASPEPRTDVALPAPDAAPSAEAAPTSFSSGLAESLDAPNESPAVEDTPAAAPDAVETPVEAASPEFSRADAFRSIGAFLTQLMDAFGANEDGTSSGVLDVSLKLRLFESTLVTLSQIRTESQAPVSPLVHETIDALSGQEQAPVDRVA